jgi:hypothetical protein
VSGGRLTDEEREALTCDCDESSRSEEWCPLHADMPHLSPDLPASYLISSVEHIVAQREAAAAEKALRDAADEADRFADETYPDDIFRRPTSDDYAAINALLLRELGHQLDGVAADCMHRAIRVQAGQLRERAARIREDGTR